MGSTSDETHLTADDVIEKTRAEHGDAAADLVAREIASGRTPKRGRRPLLQGRKGNPGAGVVARGRRRR